MSSSSSDTVELNLTPNLSDKGTKVYLTINNVNMEEGFTATLIPKYVTPSGELIAARTNTNFRKNGNQYELVVPEFYQMTWDGLPRGFAFNFTQNEIPEGIIPKKYLYTYDVTISSKRTSESSWNLNYSYEGLSTFENF